MTLGELYLDTYGEKAYLQIYVDLKNLSSICEANEQFPVNQKLTNFNN
jgi:hypothetical protein